MVRFNGNNRVTAFVSATLLTALLLSSDLSVAGSIPLVRISSPGGGDSNSALFNVTQPSLSPSPTPSPTPRRTRTIGRYFYVAANGTSSGDGSNQNPWKLASALKHPSVVRPGDTIWLKGGTYIGTFNSRLTGTAARPIVLRAMPGQRAIVDLNTGNTTDSRAFTVNGAHTWFWGLEFTDSHPARSTNLTGSHPADVPRESSSVTVTGSNIKLINIIIHDLSNGVRFWQTAVDSEIYGLITFNNGFHGPERGHGHGIYAQNQSGTKQIREVISFNNFSTGMKAYSETGYVVDFIFDGIVSFNNGSPEALFPGTEAIRRETNLLVGTTKNPVSNIKILNSHFHVPNGTYTTSLWLGYSSRGDNLEVSGNYVSGGFRAIDLNRWTNLLVKRNKVVRYRAKYGRPVFVDVTGATYAGIDQNTYYDALPNTDGAAFAWNGTVETLSLWRKRGLDLNSSYQLGRPLPEIFVRPNLYERGRAHIIVYNWNNNSSVTVDLGTAGLALGDNYEIRDVQNFFGSPVLSGTYSGVPIQLSLANRVVDAPIGMTQAPLHTGPDFFTFVVMRRP